MKKLAGISLFIFFCVVSAILTAGLVFYQKGNQPVKKVDNTVVVSSLAQQGVKILSMIEVAKHNVEADCWMVINNKIYNVSDYASGHPGGSRNILNYCGKEATEAFNTKGGQGDPHSSRANTMLTQFYVGDLNQKIK